MQISLLPPGTNDPAFTCTVNNLSFDNDTFVLATEEYTDASGKLVPADQVPVMIRGEEYDFDGRGLTGRWNEKDQSLQLLEIAHGETLTVKNPKTLGISTTQPTEKKESAASAGKPRAATRSSPTAAPEKKAHDPIASATQPDASDASPYRATFVENIRIEQGGQLLAECDQMNLDFLMDARSDAGDQPSSAGNNQSSRKPASKPAPAAPVATTAPAEQPIRIQWAGKLTIQPAPDSVNPPKGKETIVEMIGIDRPVVAKSRDGELRCTSFRLNTNDNSLTVRNSEAIPLVTVKDSTGVSIVTASFDYSGEHHVAVVKGKSHAEFPIRKAPASATQPAAPTGFAKVDWNESCTLRTSATAKARTDGD